MTGPVEVPGGRWTAPQNRWDLLPTTEHRAPTSLVVCYFEQQAELDRLLASVELSTGPLDVIEVIVADDGSSRPPEVPGWYGGPPVSVVRQDDRGIRPAAARNLGAAAARGEVLAFLDGDMVPSLGYLSQATQLPSVAHEAMVVGTRQHWDLEAMDHDGLTAWLLGGAAPPRLPDPEWLADGYRGQRDLLALQERSYELVIGAVLTVSRSLFDEIGGFDETIVGYGGEDWEIAHRWINAGGLLAHVDAVAHHHGLDWRGRTGPSGTKDGEALNMATRLPGRAGALFAGPASLAVHLDAPAASVEASVACVASTLRARPVGTTVHVQRDDEPPEAVSADPRVSWGPQAPPAHPSGPLRLLAITAALEVRSEALDEIERRLRPGGPGRMVLAADGVVVGRAMELRASRRVARWAGDADPAPLWSALFGPSETVDLAELGLRPVGRADLGSALAGR